MVIDSCKPLAESIYEWQSIEWTGKREGQTWQSQNIANVNLRGEGGSQNKSVGCLNSHSTKETFVYFYVIFFGIFSYFYTSAKWIIKTDEYYD